ncbi:uncharacterized protein [Leptinotarsa decemlineata]|uniref:uncharacterized protein n=1 Tax=Leptinotarsa decemlineata TaxID=7539 RepID=UPI003D304ED4
MEINRLLSDELSYELLVRGAVSDGSVDDKRKRLRIFLKLEKSGNFLTNSVEGLDPNNEIQICESKIEDLNSIVKNFDFNNTANEYAKVRTRIFHVIGRLNRVISTDFTELKCQMITRAAELLDQLEESIRQNSLSEVLNPENQGSILDQPNPTLPVIEPTSNREMLSHLLDAPLIDSLGAGEKKSDPTGSPCPVEQLVTGVQSKVNIVDVPQGEIQVGPIYKAGQATPFRETEQNLHSTLGIEPRVRRMGLQDLAMPPVESQFNITPYPVTLDFSRSFITISKWNVRFNGQGSVTNFIERIEELSYACGITEKELLHSAVILFSGTALSWYRAIRDNLDSWSSFKAKLRSTYLSSEYEEDVWGDIRNRTQGAEEKTVIFSAQMKNLFRKLSQPPSEEIQLRIIRRNLLPVIQNQLALYPIGTIDELERAARTIEDVQLRTMRMRPPPTNPSIVAEPELMYQRPRRPQVSAIQGHASSSSATDASREVCWNCREIGHRKRDCTKAFKKHCFRCGKANVTSRTCNDCVRSGNATPNHPRV